MKKLIKLMKTPGLFFRDYFDKKYPVIRNEIQCPVYEEKVLIKHDMLLENKLPTDFPIDIVYTWVDNHDEKWQEKFNDFNKNNFVQLGKYATDKARFDNHNEIFYSVKSVIINMPWVRNIFL